MSTLSLPTVPPPKNEAVLSFAPGTAERRDLEAELARQARTPVDVPLYVRGDGQATRTGKLVDVRAPHDHSLLLGHVHRGSGADVEQAITTALAAQREWVKMPFEDRAGIFLRAADAIAGKARARILAATMHGQSKTAHQAEIDAACELADFLRFNVWFAQRILAEQPISSDGVWNRVDARPLEGFVYAVTPFNFTAIAGNLPTAPAMMGNVVLWKPADNAMLAAYHVMEILRESGLPPGVITFVNADPVETSRIALAASAFRRIALLRARPRCSVICGSSRPRTCRATTPYPRIVGETGGKDFVLAHASADPAALATAVLRGGYEFQGQKCSAASRVYVPRSLWSEVRDRLVAEINKIKVGPVSDFSNFMGAVIDKKAFDRISGYQKFARETQGHQILAGGGARGEHGWFIEPTLVETKAIRSRRLMQEEIFRASW